MTPSRAVRRAPKLLAVAVTAAAMIGATTRSSAAPVPVPPPIEQAASVAAAAVRVKIPTFFPINPKPTCYVLDNFGDARSGGRSHEGVDILASLGQDVYTVSDGEIVRQAGADSSLSGNAWGIVAPDGTYYFYAHLSAFAEGLEIGDRIEMGQLIGFVGDTGNPGPGNYHLHFEVHPGGQLSAAVDPLPLLDVPSSCKVW